MSAVMYMYALLAQAPGLEAPDLTLSENIEQIWADTGFMKWPLSLCLVLGLFVIVWKFIDLQGKANKTRKVLRDVDELLNEKRIREAIELTRDSNAPAAKILYAGLERHDEGTERVMKAIENQGLIELSRLESGLVILATLTNIAPLLGFLGTVIGMIQAFQAIEVAGEVEATLVAGGIKVALLTTAAGLVIAIPVSIGHNYFVSRIDSLVIDMEESAQKMIDALHTMGTAA
ncbi:MAG: MotA/TolQ/ExbB proton channel family protein [Longimicrobiales bacterium]|nr:MotA/TolQ/ExbB proton channel family protein [Longimicrobiales bacterium]